MVGCATILAWIVVTRSLAAYLADVAPRAALWLNASQPEALTELADTALNPTRTVGASQSEEPQPATDDKTTTAEPSATKKVPYSQLMNDAFQAADQGRTADLAKVQAWAVAALQADPLDARALRILGQAADLANDDPDALKFMQAAARLSHHDVVADYWLMRRSLAAKDYKTALYFADMILRMHSDLGPYILPTVARMADDKQSYGLLKAALGGDPPWRSQFFAALPRVVTDARTPLDLLLSLRTDPIPPTITEIGYYVNFLIAHRYYSLAYYTWLQFLSPEELRHAGLLFNGSFALNPSGLPFDWQIVQGAGTTIDIVPRPGTTDGRALLVNFLYGRVQYQSVKEMVMLPPGNYQFDGEYKGDLAGPRGLKWRVVCADGNNIVGESRAIIGMTPKWQSVSFAFTVPGSGCRAQYVRLDLDSRMASEQLISGSASFGSLRISRAERPPS